MRLEESSILRFFFTFSFCLFPLFSSLSFVYSVLLMHLDKKLQFSKQNGQIPGGILTPTLSHRPFETLSFSGLDLSRPKSLKDQGLCLET